MIDYYDWAGGREAMLRFGPSEGPVVVAALPLFEEANRTRAFVVTILRALAERGIASALPDLPGQGESPVPTHEVRLANLRSAYAAAVRKLGRSAVSLAIRSGALLDVDAVLQGRWHLAPQSGAELLRELNRMRSTGSADGFGGNLLSDALLADLEGVEPASAHVVRLDSDPKNADARVTGPLLWRRAEPDNDSAFADTLAGNISDWLRTCAA